MNRRIEYIDTLKGIAIILVVMGHVVQFIWGDRYGSNQIIFIIIYSFHMPLFFFLSGLCTKVINRAGGGYIFEKESENIIIPISVVESYSLCSTYTS